MEADDPGSAGFVEMAADGIADALFEFWEGFGLGEDGLAEGTSLVAPSGDSSTTKMISSITKGLNATEKTTLVWPVRVRTGCPWLSPTCPECPAATSRIPMAAPTPSSFTMRILHLLVGPARPASSRCGVGWTSRRRGGAGGDRPSTPIVAQLPPDLTRPLSPPPLYPPLPPEGEGKG